MRTSSIRHALLALALTAGFSHAALAIGRAPFVVLDQPGPGVALIQNGAAARIYVDPADHAGVLRAAGDLRADLDRAGATGARLEQAVKPTGDDVILVGTIGKSVLIDQLIKAGKIDVSAVRGKWEGYLIAAVTQPLPGVARALVIAGPDKRGSIYGMYEVSEQIGVSPWYWWADVPVKRRSSAIVSISTRLTDAPVVRYRGIFLNDEQPALTNWAKEKFGGYNSAFDERVFELLLRMRGNYLWPAMWDSAFYDDDQRNGKLADDMGIIMGTSHHEPMMRAQKEWKRYGKGAWDYAANAPVLQEFWKGDIRNTRDFEKIITMGMRGDGDEPMSEQSNVVLLEKIVVDQRGMLQQELKKKPEGVPQLWALYKEVQDYYERGMRVPDDMLLLWCDDNWGNIRRLPTQDERKRAGAVLFGGHTAVSIPPGTEYVSDPVDMPVANGADLAISMQLVGSPGQQTGHGGSRATRFLAPGAQAGALALQDAQALVHWHQLADVEVLAGPEARAVVAIGDSITDGYGVTTDGNNRWTDVLVRRLGQHGMDKVAVINAGIGGGRLLRDGRGPHLLGRFDRDVLSRSGVSHAIVMIGVNDMAVLHKNGGDTPEAISAMLADLKLGFAQLIERAHAKGVCIIGGTVTPYMGSGYYNPSSANEAQRQALNRWIRSAGFDGVADFDLALRDPARPAYLAKQFDNDGLHPSLAGLAEMAAAVPLASLGKCRFSR